MPFRLWVTVCVIAIILFSCSRKTTGARSEKPAPASAANTPVAEKKPASSTAPAKIKIPVPAVITLNDQVARKSADGRLYYDLEGRRYWKNYRDGKYYLFNKKMYNNPDFRPQ